MSDDKKNLNNNESRKKTFEEKIYDAFPDDFKPDFKPKKVDVNTASAAEIIEATGIREIYKTFLVEEKDKQMFDVFLDGLIEQKGPIFEKIRANLGDGPNRLEILKQLAIRAGYGRPS